MIGSDCTVYIDDGAINVRVGAIIKKDNKLLLAGNDYDDYLYSIGGRIQFGESSEEAIVREVFEETGCLMEIDHLGFVHENFYYAELEGKKRMVYEICYYFYMKIPEVFEPVCNSVTHRNDKEYLKWVSVDIDEKIFPDFFRTDIDETCKEVKYRFSDDR